MRSNRDRNPGIVAPRLSYYLDCIMPLSSTVMAVWAVRVDGRERVLLYRPSTSLWYLDAKTRKPTRKYCQTCLFEHISGLGLCAILHHPIVPNLHCFNSKARKS
jgi:hypothetical protein